MPFFNPPGIARAWRMSVGHIKVILLATIVLFVSASIAISLNIVERQKALSEASHYNITWAASQALAEVLRLQNQVLAFHLPGSGVGKDEVLLRLDVLFNRLTVLNSGDLADFVDRSADQQAFVATFARVIEGLQPLVDRVEDPAAATAIVRELSSLTPGLSRLAAAAAQYGGQRVADDQNHLLKLHWIFTALAGGLLLCGLVLIGLLFRQYRIVRRAHDQLRRTTDDLQRTKDEAEAASRSKSQFLANMSHELRTPLNAIIGFADVMDQGLFGPLGNPRYGAYVADILKSGHHMYELVNDILTMARLEAAHIDLHPEDIDLRGLAETTVKMFSGTEMARGRVVRLEPPGGWPVLHADERAVRQMLLNLLSNAAKFSPGDGDIRVRCEWAPVGTVRLAVIDRGIGMTPAEVEIAVRPFQQVDASMVRKYQGAGLGLSIVKGMIEQHGGMLQIRSEPGRGSEIALLFPVHPSQLGSVAAALPASPAAAAPVIFPARAAAR